VNALTLPAQRLSSRGPGNHTPDPAGGRLLRLTWGGTRRFIGRLLTGCALARYPAYSAARSKVTTVTMMCCSPASEGGIATLQKQARNRALDLAPTIQELHAGGCSAGHCSGPGRARHSYGARRQVVCGASQPIVGGGPQPFRRKRGRRRRVKGEAAGR